MALCTTWKSAADFSETAHRLLLSFTGSGPQEKAIGIILSGTGTDGTLGVQAIKAESGMTIVQQPQAAKYSGMPSRDCHRTDRLCADARQKCPNNWSRTPVVRICRVPAVAAEPPMVPAEPMQKIFVLLRGKGHDFSAYKSNTLRRRIERRMNVHQIRKPDHCSCVSAGKSA